MCETVGSGVTFCGINIHGLSDRYILSDRAQVISYIQCPLGVLWAIICYERNRSDLGMIDGFLNKH